MNNLYTYLRGSCCFTASGIFPDRFLNLAARSDLGFWDIKRSEAGITARIIAGRYRSLLPLARKCGIRLHVKEKYGLPFRLLPYRRRAGMPLGFLIFCGILWLLAQFVWIVDIPQVSPALQQKLENEIYDAGIRQGVLRSSIDAEMMAVELQLNCRELSWVGISSNGSHVTVDVREMEKPIKQADNDKPCNIVSARDGVIISVTATDGHAVVEAGQSVAKGDLLISGVVEYSNGYVSMTHAQGTIEANTFYQLTSDIPYSLERRERTGRVITIRRLMLLGFEIPLYVNKEPDGLFERECEEWQLTAGGSTLPLTVRTERWYELKTVNRTISPYEAVQLAEKEIDEQEKALGDIEIISRTESLEQGSSGVKLTVSVIAKEDIALPELILFD